MRTVVQGSLITTFRCNAKCNMCNIWKNQTKPEEEIDYHYYVFRISKQPKTTRNIQT